MVLVMDNLNTHKIASLYEAFPPERARRIAEKLEIHHTPKHGSWLNMAEIELSVLPGSAWTGGSRRGRTWSVMCRRGKGGPQRARRRDPVAFHDGGCTDQAASPVPGPLSLADYQGTECGSTDASSWLGGAHAGW